MPDLLPADSPDAAQRSEGGRAVLVAGFAEAAWLHPDGRLEMLDPTTAARRALIDVPVVCHAPATFRRLKSQRAPAADLLELYAFVRPASFCLPTPRGLAEALGLPVPDDHTDLAAQARLLAQAARMLLAELAATNAKRRRIGALARLMAKGGWVWGAEVVAALESGGEISHQAGVAVWEDLPEWQDQAPEPAPSDIAVEPAEARRRLAELLGPGAEQRPQQADYTEALTPAFSPRPAEDAPNVVLAEAGTGVGKTLGYLAPAGLWAERNKGAVWVSTYTRHLQNQIDQELDRLYPNPAAKASRVVLRKGRENYLCLLNLADLSGTAIVRTQDAVAFGLMARWTMATRDGDLAGGDLPGWLPDLIGPNRTASLADRRGECVYAACPQYGRCFIERSVRRARKADIVIANHALVMIQAALGAEDQRLPTRYVFDEGHHLFEAIDSAFAAQLTGQETIELRRWILGAEGGRASRARGLRRRIEDLILDDAGAMDLMAQIADAARALPSEGWLQRLQDKRPNGAVEEFLHGLRQEVLARAPADSQGYGLEIDARPIAERVLAPALALDRELSRLQGPMRELAKRLNQRLDEDADVLDSATRLRIDAMARGIQRRAEMEVTAWRAMLQSLDQPMPPEFVDWFAIERVDGRELDVGFFRHYLDPTKPFVEAVAKPAHGVVVTSATLTDGSGSEQAWAAAEQRVGARHLVTPALRVRVPSPFDYANQTRVFIVTDIQRNDFDQIAAAYRELFLVSGGGALGLFTAIARLREVHRRIAPAIEQAGLDLLAQHVDAMSTASLIDIFRGERDACLLGTDAVRDGVDVPGPALRLIVFDRVPWPRPHLLHRARKSVFGGADYDDQLVRLKLKQAFGRLIRRADDHGVFVLLDRAMPSRLLSAFPAEVKVERIGLAEVIAKTGDFLAAYPAIRR